jgi:Tol biopolymer transport system component
VFLVLQVFVVVMGSVGAQADEATPTAQISVAEQKNIEVRGTRIISLSPDGKSLVAAKPVTGYARGQLCTYDVATLAERACADLSGLDSGLRVEDVVWSPDSTKIAFAEEAFKVFRDGDIWYMDAATGKLTDFTDEGIRGPVPFLNQKNSNVKEFFIDVNPAWSPDGQSLAFSRSTWRDGEWRGNEVAVLPLSGGTPRTIVQVTPDTPGIVYFGIHWQADGSRLFYNVNYQSANDPRSGIWVVDADGQNARQVARMTDPDLGPPIALQVAPAGDRVLGFYILAASQLSGKGPIYALIDVASGKATPLTIQDPNAPEHAYVSLATLSPDGSRLLYVSRLTDPDYQVFVRDMPDGKEVRLIDGLTRAFTVAYGLIPTWATDGSVFMNSDLSAGTLIRLAGGASSPPVATPIAAPTVAMGTPLAGTIEPGDTVYVNDDGVRLRSAPSRDAPAVLEVARGAPLTVLGPTEESDGFRWWPVLDPKTKTVGWVRAEFVSLAAA